MDQLKKPRKLKVKFLSVMFNFFPEKSDFFQKESQPFPIRKYDLLSAKISDDLF